MYAEAKMSTTLIRLIEEKLRTQGLSQREAAGQMQLSHTTLSRILRGMTYDIPTAIEICNWLGISPSSVIDELSDGDQLSVILSQIPEVEDVLKRLAEYPNLVRNVIAYADFLLEHRTEYSL